MESPPSSRLTFYTSEAAIPGPVEGELCGIAINVPKEHLSFISLTRGSELLPIGQSETSVYSQWPPCGPGVYELSLVCGDIRERRVITVMPRFFTESECTSIVHELAEALPNTIATQLKSCGAQLNVLPANHRSSTEDEFIRLRDAIVGTRERLGMLQILPLLQRNCHQVLKSRLELRNVEKVRRPDISRLPQAISIPGNLIVNNELYQVLDIAVESSFEAYENRLVKAYVLALRSRLSRLQEKLKSIAAPPAMAAQLDTLANDFHLAFMRATFLREVKNASVSSMRITMVLLKNPAYRAVFEGYLALNRQLSVTLEEPALNSPLSFFPYLYQRWVNLKVLSAMLQVCSEAGYRCVSHHWVKGDFKSTTIRLLNDGRPGVQLSNPSSGRLVSFVPFYSAGSTATATGVSIVIEEHGKPGKILLFEPKYWADSKIVAVKAAKRKTAKSKVAEMDGSGTVRVIEPLRNDVDEFVRFREQVKAAYGTTAEIRYAAILFPGQKGQLTPDIEALSAHPDDRDGLQKSICDLVRPYLL